METVAAKATKTVEGTFGRKDAEQKKFKRTLTCGHTVMVTFKKNAHYCESCRARRRPIAGADEE